MSHNYSRFSDMQDINPIYYNEFGIAFQWKRSTIKDLKKVQFVFRDTGLLLTKEELLQFQKSISCALKSSSQCEECRKSESCRSLLLDTPAPQVTLALSKSELTNIHDLVNGTLFQLNLDSYLSRICGD